MGHALCVILHDDAALDRVAGRGIHGHLAGRQLQAVDGVERVAHAVTVEGLGVLDRPDDHLRGLIGQLRVGVRQFVRIQLDISVNEVLGSLVGGLGRERGDVSNAFDGRAGDRSQRRGCRRCRRR